jgi:hypothetical protein
MAYDRVVAGVTADPGRERLQDGPMTLRALVDRAMTQCVKQATLANPEGPATQISPGERPNRAT